MDLCISVNYIEIYVYLLMCGYLEIKIGGSRMLKADGNGGRGGGGRGVVDGVCGLLLLLGYFSFFASAAA